MVDQNLLNYVRQQMQSGYNIDSIKKALLSQGWAEKEVMDAINSVKGQNISVNNPNNNIKNVSNKNILADMTNSKYAGFWIRVLAMILDSIIFGIIIYPAYFFIIYSQAQSMDPMVMLTPIQQLVQCFLQCLD